MSSEKDSFSFSLSENVLFRDRWREQSVKDVTGRQNRQTLNKKHRTQNTADKALKRYVRQTPRNHWNF